MIPAFLALREFWEHGGGGLYKFFASRVSSETRLLDNRGKRDHEYHDSFKFQVCKMWRFENGENMNINSLNVPRSGVYTGTVVYHGLVHLVYINWNTYYLGFWIRGDEVALLGNIFSYIFICGTKNKKRGNKVLAFFPRHSIISGER